MQKDVFLSATASCQFTNILVDVKWNSPRISMIERTQWDCVSAQLLFHDVSRDFFFTALELSTLKSWFVRSANSSNCTVTDCGSHVKRVLTLSDVLTLTLAFFLVFFGHGGMLRARGSPADLP